MNPQYLTVHESGATPAVVQVNWGGGDSVSRALDGSDDLGATTFPRARYLSQQFVEELCSAAHGTADRLIAEIERVIFQAHDHDARDGALDFVELRTQRTDRFRQARQREAAAIDAISQRISEEYEKESLLPTIREQIKQKKKLIEDYKSDLNKLVILGSDAEMKQHGELLTFAQEKREKIEQLTGQRRTFVAMQDEVASTRSTTAPEMLRQTKARHPLSGLSEQRWTEFLLDYTGPVDNSLTEYIKWIDDRILELRGSRPTALPSNESYIPNDSDLKTMGLYKLTAEITRLESLFKADQQIRSKYASVSKRIAREERELKTLERRLTDHEGAAQRREVLQRERTIAYERVFDAIIAEENELSTLYAPLRIRLAEASGTLNKLEFSVLRSADAAGWAEIAEETLLDRRQAGEFKGKGSLIEKAEADLKTVWETGSAREAKEAMIDFISRYNNGLLEHAPVPPAEHEAFRAWLQRFARWIFSTEHIDIHYGIAYDGVDISKLSPGTRGIVLLLLYLALDDADYRPLIIDQPEENLDPKSVFDELVALFVAAKGKRQVIMVTHNANLVINTDADQIIIAKAEPSPDHGLPCLTYLSGGIEDAYMREEICDILEGGEHAFRERARRLRVRLER